MKMKLAIAIWTQGFLKSDGLVFDYKDKKYRVNEVESRMLTKGKTLLYIISLVVSVIGITYLELALYRQGIELPYPTIFILLVAIIIQFIVIYLRIPNDVDAIVKEI